MGSTFTHNAYRTGPNLPREAGLQQRDAFESVGVYPRRVAVGHTCCLDEPKAEVIMPQLPTALPRIATAV